MMKAILTITVEKKLKDGDKEFYEELLGDGDTAGLWKEVTAKYACCSYELRFEE
jgi:hypothetical protein